MLVPCPRYWQHRRQRLVHARGRDIPFVEGVLQGREVLCRPVGSIPRGTLMYCVDIGLVDLADLT